MVDHNSTEIYNLKEAVASVYETVSEQMMLVMSCTNSNAGKYKSLCVKANGVYYVFHGEEMIYQNQQPFSAVEKYLEL